MPELPTRTPHRFLETLGPARTYRIKCVRGQVVEKGFFRVRPTFVNIDVVLESSEEVLRMLGARHAQPRHAIAALALALGRMCERYGVSVEQALTVAQLASMENVPAPAKE